MSNDWLLHISYGCQIGFAVLLFIQVAKIYWVGVRYVTGQGGLEKCSETKEVIFRSSIKLSLLMVLLSVNKFVLIALAGSEETWHEWKMTHAESLGDMALVMFIFLFVYYGIKLLCHYMKEETENVAECPTTLLDRDANVAEETPERELERVLALVQERYK